MARVKKAAGATRAGRDEVDERTRVEVVVERADATQVETSLLVVDAYEGIEAPHELTAAVDEACGGALARAITAGDFKGRFKETLLVHPATGPHARVLLVGMGKLEDLTPDRVRRVAAVTARKARDLAVETCHTVLHGSRTDAKGLPAAEAAEALAEGALLGLYTFPFYNTTEREKRAKWTLARVVIVEKHATKARQAEKGAAAGTAVAEATWICRDWATWSGAEAAPERYGERAKRLARENGLKAQVFDKARLEREGFGGLLAVNQGSVREPRFLVLDHAPAKPKGTVVLVGKGICFDSGGISIKPSDRMQDMKFDKCGAAAVVGAVVAAAKLDLPLRVVALAPMTDNLPSGSAYKPGDVVTTLSGKTIEVVNTDAEGRVILSDALTWGARLGPDAMVELSTLTGACPIAVGHHAIAAMGNSDALVDQLRAAGRQVNERVWPLPFFDEYGEMIKSKVADVLNSAGRTASCITAGKFLEHFIGDHPWVHLDIASTAYHDGTSPKLNEEYSPEQATGVGTRLLVRWMRDFRKPAWTKKKA